MDGLWGRMLVFVWLRLGEGCSERASVFLMLPDGWRLTATVVDGGRNYWHVSTVLGRVGEMIHKRARMQAAYAGARGGQGPASARWSLAC